MNLYFYSNIIFEKKENFTKKSREKLGCLGAIFKPIYAKIEKKTVIYLKAKHFLLHNIIIMVGPLHLLLSQRLYHFSYMLNNTDK